jgi:hypothetical protein
MGNMWPAVRSPNSAFHDNVQFAMVFPHTWATCVAGAALVALYFPSSLSPTRFSCLTLQIFKLALWFIFFFAFDPCSFNYYLFYLKWFMNWKSFSILSPIFSMVKFCFNFFYYNFFSFRIIFKIDFFFVISSSFICFHSRFDPYSFNSFFYWNFFILIFFFPISYFNIKFIENLAS